MKKIIFLLVMIAPFFSKAQTANDTYVEQYCELIAQARLLSNRVSIDVDYGEARKFFSLKDTRVKDEAGEVRKFNSVIDALNYMGQRGWKLVNAFPVATVNGPMVYHYVFKKEFPKRDVDKAEGSM